MASMSDRQLDFVWVKNLAAWGRRDYHTVGCAFRIAGVKKCTCKRGDRTKFGRRRKRELQGVVIG